MNEYYLKIPFAIRNFYPGVPPSEWRESILDDVTDRGTRIVVERLPADGSGERAALHGDKFYVHVAEARERTDCLCVIRIESAANNLPRRPPISVQCRMTLWPGKSAPRKDSVLPLLGVSAIEMPTEVGDTDADVRPGRRDLVEPSPLLRNVLAQTPLDIRRKFRPANQVPEPADAHAFIDALAATWRRRGLSRYADATPREETLLKRVIKPAELGRGERDELLSLFGFDVLNKAALHHRYDAPRFFLIVDEFADLPLSPVVRARIWTAMLAGLTSSDLREELFQTAEGLRMPALRGTPVERTFNEGLVTAIRDVAERHDDSALTQVADAAEASGTPAAAIAAWAAELGFGRVVEAAGPPPFATHQPQPPLEPVDGFSSISFDAWAFRTGGADGETVQRISDELARLVHVDRRTVSDLSGVLGLQRMLAELQAKVGGWLAELPAPETVEADLESAQKAYARLRSVVPTSADALLASVNPSEAHEICDLLVRHELLSVSPAWLWSLDDAVELLEPHTATFDEFAKRLLEPEIRARLLSVIALLDQLGDPRPLRWLGAPPPGDPVEKHIHVWFERTRTLLQSAPADTLDQLYCDGGSLDDVVENQHASTAFDAAISELDDQVHDSVRQHLSDIVDVPERRRWQEAYRNAIEDYRELFGNPDAIGAKALRTRAEVLLAGAASKSTESDTAALRVKVEHNWTEESGRKATLVFRQPDPSQDYGVVAAPIVLETRRPRQLDLRLVVDVKGDPRGAWPREWPDVEPSGPLTVPAYAWLKQPDSDEWQHPLTLTLPIRRPRSGRVEVTVHALDPHTNEVLGPRATLNWESVELKMPPLELKWAGTTNPEYVESHPIGPQGQADTIMSRLQAGGSLAVIAPRRFGKSTLVEYVVKAARDRKLLVPDAIVCTDYSTPGGIDYDKLWTRTSEWFYANVGVSLPPGTTGPLPDQSAFDQIRRAAKKGGYEAVVLVLDEAQLFFPGGAGPDLGTRLKNLLERHWSRIDDKAKAPLLVALIGLPTLRERAGADLMGLLSPIAHEVIRERDLRPLITRMINGLQTTRAARQRLSEVAGNLFILRVLLDRLVVRLKDQGRIWANSDDVLSVEGELKQELLAGREQDVAMYIRDALNRAEKVTDWDPVTAFATAAALADVRQDGRGTTEILSRVCEKLNQWCKLNASNDNIRAVYDIELVTRHVESLRERRVLKEMDFASGLLDAWLEGVARNASYEGFRESLVHGALRRISLPPEAEHVTRGGQAEIWRAASPDGKGQLAFRVRHLESPAEEKNFQQTIELFDALRGGVIRREPGADGLFDVIDVGLDADDAERAILVYRWIDGTDMSDRQGKLPGDIVTDIGVKLARTLSLVHSQNILHRDIKPANIVLDDTLMRPVLIDFGFARRIGTQMQTRLAGDLCAPEVRIDHPEWTRAADVYALAATLKSLLKPSDAKAKDLAKVLDAALAQKPEERPAADTLLEGLETVARGREVERKKQDAWAAIQRAIDSDRHKAWFMPVVRKFRPHFEAMSLAFFGEPIQRYREVADFLNQVLEAFPQGGLTLRALAGRHPEDRSLRALQVVRNSDAHYGRALSRDAKDALQEFQAMPADEQKREMEQGIAAVAATLQLPSLPGLLNRFL